MLRFCSGVYAMPPPLVVHVVLDLPRELARVASPLLDALLLVVEGLGRLRREVSLRQAQERGQELSLILGVQGRLARLGHRLLVALQQVLDQLHLRQSAVGLRECRAYNAALMVNLRSAEQPLPRHTGDGSAD